MALSCMNQVYRKFPAAAKPGTLFNRIFIVNADCTTGDLINDLGAEVVCSDSTFCDFSRPVKLALTAVHGNNQALLNMDNPEDIEGVDISNWNLRGERIFLDNNRLSSWGLQDLRKLKIFRAKSCSMTVLT
eukprot:Awhi_evm1s15373